VRLSRSTRRFASTMPPSDLSDESGKFGWGASREIRSATAVRLALRTVGGRA
jgi:hypothetical protein